MLYLITNNSTNKVNPMKKTAIKSILCLSIIISLSSCAPTQITFNNVHPDWNPPQGLEYANAKCEAKMNESYKVDPQYGIKSVNRKVFKSCMEAYGYELVFASAYDAVRFYQY